MSLFDTISKDLMQATKARNAADQRALQGIKATLLNLRTEKGAGGQITPEGELKALQKMAKQRRDSIDIFKEQGRDDLVAKEEEELEVIERYLPAQMSDEELEKTIQGIIDQTGASSMADMGKVMGMASKQLSGKADGKRISEVVKQLLG